VLLTNVQAAQSWEQTDADKKKMLYETQQYLYKASPDWACGGILLFDAGSSMDMPIYFAEESTRKHLCTLSGMAGHTLVDPNDTCPPKAWINNGCEDKRIEIGRRTWEKSHPNQKGK